MSDRTNLRTRADEAMPIKDLHVLAAKQRFLATLEAEMTGAAHGPGKEGHARA